MEQYERKIVKEFRSIRTKAISEMFDNVDENGIFPTTEFFNVLDEFLTNALAEQKARCKNALTDIIRKE